MSDHKLQVESFGAWILATQLLASLGGTSPQMIPNATAAVSLPADVSVDALMRDALSAGRERMVITDADGRVLASTWGERTSVRADATISAFLKRSGANVVLYHNHPDNGTFSPADLQIMLDSPGISQSVLVTKKGSYVLSHVKPTAVTVYADEMRYHAGRGTPRERMTHEIMKTLQKKGLVQYSKR